ncbi:Ig-like domain-containing protein [Streptomyces sp. NPDC003781]|uniref:Ig-like domain-containing protein n=1 Tax=Streptomyces sp. NPDC003781 TaxID=3364686 RepID=UPI0036A5C892
MNLRTAPLRSPVALLTCCALLCAALAAIVASAGRADAAPTTVGAFTLSPGSGKITDDPPAASAATGAGCPESTAGTFPTLAVYKPGAPVTGVAATAIARATTAIPAGEAPFTVSLGPHASKKTLKTALEAWSTTGSLDGTYALTLTCGGGFTSGPRFLGKIQVAGDTWTMVQQRTTSLTLSAPVAGVPVGGDLELTATVTPAEAAGTVEFKDGDRSLGTVDVAGGVARTTVTAPSVGGPHTYTAAFTAADQEAYTDAVGTVSAGITYLVSAKGADGSPLGDKPTLAIGQGAKITIKGFTPGAKVEVTQQNANGVEFPDAVPDAEGTVVDYAYTVPDRTISGETDLYFAEDGSANKRATFAFVAADEPTDDPTDPTDPAGLEVTDEDGAPLGDNPNLDPGQTVKITARGFSAEAAVSVTLADSEADFEDAKANADGTVEEYAFTVPAKIEDGDHTLTLAEAEAEAEEEGHSVDFAFTTGEEPGGDPGPSPSASDGTDTAGADGGADGGADSGGTVGGGGGTGGGGTGGSMASTGAQVGAIGLAGLALVGAGAALVVHVRRRGLLSFGGDTGATGLLRGSTDSRHG